MISTMTFLINLGLTIWTVHINCLEFHPLPLIIVMVTILLMNSRIKTNKLEMTTIMCGNKYPTFNMPGFYTSVAKEFAQITASQ
jgi:hypothetical protein